MPHVILLSMPFSSSQEVENRLGDPTPLTPQEVRDLLPWMNQIGDSGMRHFHAQLALRSFEAVQKFERSTVRLTRWLTGLTLLLLVLTILTLYGIFAPAHLERTIGQPSAAQESQGATMPILSGKRNLGPWNVKFGIPGSADVPEKSPIIKWSFAQDMDTGFGYIAVTAANLTDRPYSVRYNIYGYQDGRRISEGNDEFTIGKRETVVRKVFLVSQQSAQAQLGSVFSIQVVLQE